MFVFRWIAFGLFVMTGSTGVSASELSGKQLLASCAAEKNTYRQGICEGYLLGFINTFKKVDILNDLSTTMLKELHELRKAANIRSRPPLPYKPQYCLPADLTAERAIAGVGAWLRAHPARLDQRASNLMVFALRDTWPCERK